MKRRPIIMVQGTASSVGKSLVATALCRLLARFGLRVAPYKAQNMSNNAAALPGGGEIGRAQALQALAAGVEPRAEMNPVLIKPEGDSRSQVVLMGRPWKTLRASDYRTEREPLWKAATESLDCLRAAYDAVVIEGAGSPVELNLKSREIVNMAIARYANSPVLLVGDIDAGGIFAQFAGTLSLLEAEERALVRGLVVNKFRGDMKLFESGIAMLRDLCGLPVLGVLPWLHGLSLAEEDGTALDSAARRSEVASRGGNPGAAREGAEGRIDIAIIKTPRISNFDDIDALALEEDVSIRFVERASELGLPDAIILPGSKATLSDLAWLKSEGLDDGIRWAARLGTWVVGLCGGYQMLGAMIDDSRGVEGEPRVEPGIGLLPVETFFESDKKAMPRRGRVAEGGEGFLAAARGIKVEGYEIHAGTSVSRGRALLELEASTESAKASREGCQAMGGRVFGTYLHGIFDLPEFRRAWLDAIAPAKARGSSPDAHKGPARSISLEEARQAALDRLADAFVLAMDMDGIMRIIGL